MEFDFSTIMSIVVAIIGAAAGIWKTFDAAFWKNIAVQSFELVEVVKTAKEESSPGGATLTLEERALIGDEALDIAIPLWDKFATKLTTKTVTTTK